MTLAMRDMYYEAKNLTKAVQPYAVEDRLTILTFALMHEARAQGLTPANVQSSVINLLKTIKGKTFDAPPKP